MMGERWSCAKSPLCHLHCKNNNTTASKVEPLNDTKGSNRTENKSSIYWKGRSAFVAFALNVRILARKKERLAFQYTQAFQDMAVYSITFVGKMHRCLQELMFLQQYTVSTMNATWWVNTVAVISFFITAFIYL